MRSAYRKGPSSCCSYEGFSTPPPTPLYCQCKKGECTLSGTPPESVNTCMGTTGPCKGCSDVEPSNHYWICSYDSHASMYWCKPNW